MSSFPAAAFDFPGSGAPSDDDFDASTPPPLQVQQSLERCGGTANSCFGLFQDNNPMRQRSYDEEQAGACFFPISQLQVPKPRNLEKDGISTQDIDSSIAKEMTQLSMQEREQAMNDLHAIVETDENLEKSPAQVNQWLWEMSNQLQILKQGSVYELAEAMHRTYVSDPTLRIMFLRAVRYDPKAAAERMIRFFELKRNLFGYDKLGKDITLEDLDEDDMNIMRGGSMQIACEKDAAGRVIIMNLLKIRTYKSLESLMRAQYYTLMTTLESVEGQKRGIVMVYFLFDTPGSKSVSSNIRKSLPVHFAALHLCYNDFQQFAMVSAGVYMLPASTKVRYRSHFGSQLEVEYELGTFGIPRSAFPIHPNGDFDLAHHLQWLNGRHQLESARKAQATASLMASSADTLSRSGFTNSVITTSVTPTVNDVLFGRGKTVVEHPGNAKFRDIVDKQMKSYEVAPRLEKTFMAGTIVRLIQEKQGRFLKRDTLNGWTVVDDNTAREKVAHAFRNRKKFHNLS